MKRFLQIILALQIGALIAISFLQHRELQRRNYEMTMFLSTLEPQELKVINAIIQGINIEVPNETR